MPQFPSELAFFGLLQYAVRGTSELSRRSKVVRNDVKAGKELVLERVARRVAENIDTGGVLAECFRGAPTLIPMPRSAPLLREALWPSLQICEALRQAGIGGSIWPGLRRVKAVPKSALARPGERPEPPDHYASLVVEPADMLQGPAAIVVVDDVVTRGSSLVGMFPRLVEAFPGIPIRCFAVLRTISEGDIPAMLAPVTGFVTYSRGRLQREP